MLLSTERQVCPTLFDNFQGFTLLTRVKFSPYLLGIKSRVLVQLRLFKVKYKHFHRKQYLSGVSLSLHGISLTSEICIASIKIVIAISFLFGRILIHVWRTLASEIITNNTLAPLRGKALLTIHNRLEPFRGSLEIFRQVFPPFLYGSPSRCSLKSPETTFQESRQRAFRSPAQGRCCERR